ncbi:MAG: class I SAM-dependent methyltransferase [Gammaproteobacteria bacterium]
MSLGFRTRVLPALSAWEEGRVRAMIQKIALLQGADGPLYFDRYMECTLYDPSLGYYRQGRSPIGRAGDFVTLPETTPLFAATLARVFAPLYAAGLDRTLVEIGPGTGQLAGQLAGALDRAGTPLECCVLVEPNQGLWPLQQSFLNTFPGAGRTRFEWCTISPARWAGILVMNEIVDAFPVALVEKGRSGWFEWGVGHRAGQIVFEPLVLRAPVGAALGPIEEALGQLPTGYRTECNPALAAQLETILSGCTNGCAFVVDYGYSRRHYYHPDRGMGTLQCYFHQLVHDDPLHAPGVEDLTAMVDFTSLAEAAAVSGFELAGYASLAPFLLAAGLVGSEDSGGPDAVGSADHARWVREVCRLTEPHEAGELFKVMMLAKGKVPDVAAFASCDQSDRL